MVNLTALLKDASKPNKVFSDSTPPIDPAAETQNYRLNKRLVRVNQTVLYKSAAGIFKLKIVKIEGPRAFIGSSSLGTVMVDLADFHRNPDKSTMWMAQSKQTPPKKEEVTSTEDDSMFNSDTIIAAEQMKVLVDEPGQALAKKLFKQFVSENDFSDYPSFIIGMDNLLFEFRGNKPITIDEVDEFSHQMDNEVDEIKDKRLIHDEMSEQGGEDSPDDDDEFSEQTASTRYAYTVEATHIQHRLTAFMNALNCSENAAVIDLKNYAYRLGFRPDVNLLPDNNTINHVLSMSKVTPKYKAQFTINNTKDGSYLMAVAHTRRGAETTEELIRPWRHTFTNPNKLVKDGRKVLQRYDNEQG